MKIRTLLPPVLLLLSLFSTTTYANCPLPHTIVYQCHEFNNHKMCTWSPTGGWYQGSADNSTSINEGDHLGPNAFQKAIWFPYRDEISGATNCIYVGPEGERITLFQQTGYGDVPQPNGRLSSRFWTPSSADGFPDALECTAGPARCKFEFGERV